MKKYVRAFTLIELLVVIAIIGILAAILFPVLANAKERGRQLRCLNNLKHLALAVNLYCDDNNARFPIARFTGNNLDWAGCVSVGGWCYPQNGSLFKYVKSIAIYKCPTDAGLAAKAITDLPKGKTQKDYPLSYTMNTAFWGPSRSATSSSNTTVQIQSIARSKDVLMFIHEARTSINDGDFNWVEGGINDIPSNVHYNGTTVVYVDTHAAWQSFEMLRTARNEGLWDVTVRPTPPLTKL